MKKLLFTKISKDTVYLFLLLGLSLGLIVWTIQAVNYLDYVTQDGHGLKTYFLYSVLNFPKIIHRMIPFIFFISLFLILINYETKNELLIFWTHGVTKIKFANVIIFLSVLLFILQIFIGAFVSPHFQYKSRALLNYEKKFSNNKEIKLSADRIKKSIRELDPKVKKAIDYAYSRIWKFHSKQIKGLKERIIYVDKFKNKLEYRNVPIESVGIYVPGNLPSTLLMNSIPAKMAGVKKIILATPKINGKLNPAVLYAAKKIGIKEIYSMGGAQAIASFAYIQKVNKVIGPGNKYVAEAKRQLSGKIIGTETMYAGPSEICILADNKTDLNQIITSIVSQAEHDPDSQCILITKDKKIINKVKLGITKILKTLPRKKIATTSLKKNGLIIIVKNDKQILNVINEIAPEHLEINVKNYKKYDKKIFNVGSICNGRYTPMSVSDYTVGTNHVLPTSGSSKFLKASAISSGKKFPFRSAFQLKRPRLKPTYAIHKSLLSFIWAYLQLSVSSPV